MKKITLIFLFYCSIIFCSCAQEVKEKKIDPEFKTFLDVFPIRILPFRLSADQKLASPFEVPLPKIPTDYANKYIKINELDKVLAICPDEFIYGYLAFSRFDISDEFITVIITISADSGCGERNLLVNYNFQGSYIDHIIIYGSNVLKKPSSVDGSRTMLFHQGLVNKDFIEVYERIVAYSAKNKILSEDKTTRVYKIEQDGKFRLRKEEKK